MKTKANDRSKMMIARVMGATWLLLLVGCAGFTSNSHTAPEGTGLTSAGTTGTPEDNKWSAPLIDGVEIPTADAAADDLSFTPVVPQGLGDPTHIFESDPNAFAKEVRGFALVFDHPELGRFLVIEEPTDTTQEELESFPESHNSPGSSVTFEMVVLQDGTRALSEDGQDAASLEWLVSGLAFKVLGPKPTFDAEKALTVANDF